MVYKANQVFVDSQVHSQHICYKDGQTPIQIPIEKLAPWLKDLPELLLWY